MIEHLTTSVRAFLALKLGDEIESAIAAFIDELRAPRDCIRWVPRGNLHLTLKFLGDAVPPDRLASLARAVSLLAHETPALELVAIGAGAFPNLARPRVVWVAIGGDGLATLASRVETAAVHCGFARDARPWSPHMTIGRIRDSRKFTTARAAIERHAHRRFGAARVSAIALFRSIRGNTASTYHELATFPFSPCHSEPQP